MKIYTICILTGVAFFLAACNETSSEPEVGVDKVAEQLNGKLFAVGGDVKLKSGVSHYVFYHSASW